MFLESYVEGAVWNISCYNLHMLIDICHIYQIYLSYTNFSGQKFTYGIFCFEGDFEVGSFE